MANEDRDEALRRIEKARETGATILDLFGLKIDTLPPKIADLTNLHSLDLHDTQVADLSHVADLTNLHLLDLDNTQVADLRLLLDLPRLTHPDFPEKGRGVYFSDTPACNDPAIATAAEIEDDEVRLQTLLAHLRILPPWPEPLPAHIGASSASGPVPEAPDAPPFPVLRLTHDHRIDLPHLDTPTGIDPAILERLYDRLRRDVDKLSRYANRYEGLSEIVPSLNRSLGNEFDSMDAVNLHLDLSELFDLRGAEPDGIDPWEADARSAADIVLRSGPGLTVSHPEVEAHEKLLTTFARRTSPPTTRAEEIIVQDLSENPAIATESTRSFGKRLAVSTSGGRVADTRQAFARKVILMLVLVGEGLSAAVEGAVYGEALKAAQPAAEFLWLHRNEVMAIAQDWGGQAARWADYVLRQARDIVDRAKDEPL